MYRDIEYDAGYIAPWAALFRRPQAGAAAMAQVVASYERRMWQLEQETETRRQAGLDSCAALRDKERAIDAREAAGRDARDQAIAAHRRALDVLLEETSPEAFERRVRQLVGATGLGAMQRIARLRATVSPAGSRRDVALGWAYRASRALRRAPRS
jgi:hypothetical protein